MGDRLRRTVQRVRSQVTGSLNHRVMHHLGCDEPQTITRAFPSYLARDVAVSMWRFLNQHCAEVVRYDGNPAELLAHAKLHPDPGRTPPALEQIEADSAEVHQGLRRGVAILQFRGTPLFVHCWADLRPRGERSYHVFLAAPRLELAETFLEEFTTFEREQGVFASRIRAKLRDSLNHLVREHMGTPEGRTPVLLTRTFPQYEIPNVSIMAREMLEELGARFTGRPSRVNLHDLLQEPRINDEGRFEGHERSTPEYTRVSLRLDEHRLGLARGLALLTWNGAPLLASCHKADRYKPEYELAVMAWDPAVASSFLEAFDAFERRRSVFRGRLIRPRIDYGDRIEEAELLDHAPVDWDRVVLPSDLRRVIEEDVIEYVRQAPALAANGLELKRGILFHGLPGTGKSYVCRLLASVLPGFTGIVLAGENLRRAAAAFAMARRLAPAILFFEDVDLVARERDSNSLREVLGTLLNELDGLARSDQVFCVFTTNRLDTLEEALAQRPGRVDLVLEFPLPEADLRRRLIQLYVGKAGLDSVDIERLVGQTAGATPAFLRELMKQAVFQAARAGARTDGDGLVLRDEDVQGALTKMRARCRDPRLERILGFCAGVEPV